MAGIEHRDTTGKIDKSTSFNIPELGILGVVNEEVAHDGNTPWCRCKATLVPFCVGRPHVCFHNCIHRKFSY
jgi:hypothetical protein